LPRIGRQYCSRAGASPLDSFQCGWPRSSRSGALAGDGCWQGARLLEKALAGRAAGRMKLSGHAAGDDGWRSRARGWAGDRTADYAWFAADCVCGLGGDGGLRVWLGRRRQTARAAGEETADCACGWARDGTADCTRLAVDCARLGRRWRTACMAGEEMADCARGWERDTADCARGWERDTADCARGWWIGGDDGARLGRRRRAVGGRPARALAW
jgi:hypothetical protein